LKELIKRNYRRARRIVLGSRKMKEATVPAVYPEGTDFSVAPTSRILIQGGTVLTLDRQIGDFATADVLIEGEAIREIRPNLAVDEAEVIDARGMIVMPGFVDTHRHIWEGILRNIGTDVPLEGRTSYITFVLHKLAPALRPRSEERRVGKTVQTDRR